MKYFLLFLLFLPMSFISILYADGCDATSDAISMLKGCATNTTGINPNDGDTWQEGVKKRIVTIAQTAITLGALLAVGAIVWAGIQYTRAYGEDEKLKHAKSTAIFALIGLVLLMGSFPLVDIFINFIYNVIGT